jgi:hypothetical protein
MVANWLRREQGEAIEHLHAENGILRSRLGPKRLRFTDAERRWLAERGAARPNATGHGRIPRDVQV